MAVYVGLDIGGTKLMAAATSEEGRILRKERRATAAHWEQDLQLLDEMVAQVAGGETISGMGAAIGGPLDWQKGVVSPLHQPTWRQIPLKAIMEKKYACPFYVDVDTNVAAVGEYHTSHLTARRFIYLTLSTGMGGGLLLDGQIYRGKDGAHPEFGHQAVPFRCSNPQAVQCECGASDCLEALVSGSAIRRIYGKPAEELGEQEWEEVAYNLGQGLRNLAAVCAPDLIRLGGGVAVGGGQKLVDAARRVMEEHLRIVPAPDVSLSSLGYETALIGATTIARLGL